MAGVVNPFAVLDDADGAISNNVTKSKNKKKNKKKKSEPSVEHYDLNADARQSSTAADQPLESDASFQIKNPKRKQGNSSRAAANGVSGAQSNKASHDAFLKAATAAAKGKDRNDLIIDWVTQLTDDQRGDLRSNLLRSGAIEHLLLAVAADASPKDAAPLAALLSSIADPSLPAEFPAALAELVVASGRVAPRDSLAPTPQAAAAGSAGMALLESGLPRELKGRNSPDGALQALKSLAGRVAASQAALENAASSKEEIRAASQLFKVAKEGAEIADPNSAGLVSPEAAAVLSTLETLRSALSTRIRMLSSIETTGTVEEQVAAAERSRRREDATLAAQEADAEAAVADIERQLFAAKIASKEARERRVAAAERHEKTVKQLRSGAAASAASSAEVASGLDAAKTQAERLDKVLRGAVSSSGLANGAAAAIKEQATQLDIPGIFSDAAVRLMEASVKHLKELSTKTTFYRDRINAAARQAEHLAMLNDPRAVSEHTKQRASMDKMLRDSLTSISAADKAVQAAVDAWRARKTQLRCGGGGGGAGGRDAAAGKRIEALAAEAAEIAEDAVAGRVPAAAAADPALPHINGSKAGAKGNNNNNSRPPSSLSEHSGGTTPASTSVLSAATAHASDSEASRVSVHAAAELAALEQRLVALEAENRKKDEQIAAMLQAASVDIPSPAPIPAASKAVWGSSGSGSRLE